MSDNYNAKTKAHDASSSTTTNKRRKHGDNSPSSFIPLLRHFVGMKNITIELKTGRSYHGELIDFDHFMNITLNCRSTTSNKDAVSSSTSGSKHNKPQQCKKDKQGHEEEIIINKDDDEVIIRGPTIRYVFFPDNVNLNGMIRDGMVREKSAENKYQRGVRKRK